MLKNRYQRIMLFCSIIGGILGLLLYLSLEFNWIPSFPIWLVFILGGLVVGLLFGLAIPFYQNFRHNLYLEEISVSVPRYGNMKFKVNREYRLVAWNLFIETMTRISTQPLNDDQGILEEALNSLYKLFTITRELLKEMEPSKESGEMTVELLAVKMLNYELRPFLSKWHPRFVARNKNSPKLHDQDWEFSSEFREELEVLRKAILSYAEAFGKLSCVTELDSYFEQ